MEETQPVVRQEYHCLPGATAATARLRHVMRRICIPFSEGTWGAEVPILYGPVYLYGSEVVSQIER